MFRDNNRGIIGDIADQDEKLGDVIKTNTRSPLCGFPKNHKDSLFYKEFTAKAAKTDQDEKLWGAGLMHKYLLNEIEKS